MGKEKEIKRIISEAKKVLIKIGSGVIASDEGVIKEEVVSGIIDDIAYLMETGREVIVVSSGAVACGMSIMGFKVKPSEIPKRQALASIGQAHLIRVYEKYALRRGFKVGQILLTREDIENRKRFINARNTIKELIKWKVIPVVNENDTVAVEEIKFGDNDKLASLVAIMMEVNLVIMLSTVGGLYTSNPLTDPDAKLIDIVDSRESFDISKYNLSGGSFFGTGGMYSKLLAIEQLMNAGIPAIITKGEPFAVRDVFEKRAFGTFFYPSVKRLPLRKMWIKVATNPAGKIVIDEGACKAIVGGGKSLLPSGVIDVEGDFDMGEVVACVDVRGVEVARGIVNYSSEEIRKIKGLRSSDIEEVLGYKHFDEVIHRDNLVISLKDSVY